MAKFGVLFLGLAFIVSMSIGCSPKDEKVSNRFTGGGGGTGTTDARIDDRVTEYSRSMLIELADVARQAEAVLQVVASRDSAPPEVSGDPVPQALRTSGCKTVKMVPETEPRTEGELEFQTEIKACKEKGVSFEGLQFGHEVSSANFVKIAPNSAGASLASPGASSSTVATVIKVIGKGIQTVLKPNVNPKDTLRVTTSRFLSARLVREENGTRLYRFTFENFSNYSLDLKSLRDQGAFTSTISGILIYDVQANRVTGFRSDSESDRMNIRVESAREGRSGGRVVRQEFFGSGLTSYLAIELSQCALPIGEVQSRFTVRPLVGDDRKFIIDSSTTVESQKDFVVDAKKPGAFRKPAKLCSNDEQITMTEFYAGLLY